MNKLLAILTMIFLISVPVLAQEIDYCEGDFDCDGDCDGTDASVFKSDFGRSDFSNPCPPRTPLPILKTGQIACYDNSGNLIACAATGQDGDLQMGFPNPRFADNGNNTITDNLTGLIWLKDATCMATNYPDFDNDDGTGGGIGDGKVTWQHALDFVRGINDGTYPLCGAGFTDWRLPNIIEIFSLINFGGSLSLPPPHPFINIDEYSDDRYWTSTSSTYSAYIGNALMLGIFDRFTSPYPKTPYTFNVWPVRGGHPSSRTKIPLSKTGQTICYDNDGNPRNCEGTGEDGEYQMGFEWPNPRFTDNADGTVTDNLTDLIWVKDHLCHAPSYHWDQAITFCNELQNGQCGITDGSVPGEWRLPNIRELMSIIHYGVSNPTLPNTEGTGQWTEGNPFTNVLTAYYYYWSSTTCETIFSNTGRAFDIDIRTGFVGNGDKIYNRNIWCVKNKE